MIQNVVSPVCEKVINTKFKHKKIRALKSKKAKGANRMAGVSLQLRQISKNRNQKRKKKSATSNCKRFFHKIKNIFFIQIRQMAGEK